MRALVAMSGGVDSSVAALLVKSAGYEAIGCTMKLFDGELHSVPQEHTCCSLDDVEDARSVARRLGMPYYVFNFKDGFREKVIDRFIAYYKAGKTPNPCIDCNRYMKFDTLYERARILGCEYVVTGHYARIEFNGQRFQLKKAADETKDQSYVLYFMTQFQLAHTMFPLGDLHKTQARKIAAENGFMNAMKSDSQDICFVPDGDYAQVIESLSGEKSTPGDFVDIKGNRLGRHKGIIHYTIGQRKRLGVSAGEPLFVCKIDAENNTVILGRNADTFSAEADLGNVNWVSGETPASPFACTIKIRYRQSEVPCTVYPDGNERAHVVFDQPQRAVTPGQAGVLYAGDTVLGGGEIIS